MAARGKKERITYPRIFALHYKPDSGCKYFEVKEMEGYYVAKCKVLGRFIVKDMVYKCEKYWEDCPFRRIALRMNES